MVKMMTNVKYDKSNPAPGVPGITFTGNASITASATGASIKPISEKLPEGYLDDGDALYFGTDKKMSRLIAAIDQKDGVIAGCAKEHFLALAIWLQRKMK